MNHIRERESVKEFNMWAANYDEGLLSAYFRSCYKKTLSLVEKDVYQSNKILDIGCGTGNLTFLLAEKNIHAQVLGLDISPKMISIAEKKKKEKGVLNTEFIISKVHPTPFEKSSFNMVFCLNALHHFPDHAALFKEVARVLKPKGVFVLLDLMNDGFVKKTWIFINKALLGEKEVEYHSKSELRNMLSQAGLRVEVQKPFLFFILITISRKI